MVRQVLCVLILAAPAACSKTANPPTTPTSTTPTASQTWVTEGVRLTDGTAGFPGQIIADVAAIQLRDGRWRLLLDAGGAIRSAVSQDGLTFTMESGIRLGSFPVVGRAAFVKALLLADGRLRVYFQGNGTMYSAVSSDEGVTFTVEDGVRVAASAAPLGRLTGGSVVRTRDGQWRMYFSDVGPGLTPKQIMSASSSDLLTWMVDAGVRIGAGATVSGSSEHPSAIVNSNGSISIFYFRNNPTGVYTATSVDGLSFSSETSTGIKEGNDPEVVLTGGMLRMYYNWGNDSGGAIYSATSAPASTPPLRGRALLRSPSGSIQ